jgi:hypothetical protein
MWNRLVSLFVKWTWTNGTTGGGVRRRLTDLEVTHHLGSGADDWSMCGNRGREAQAGHTPLRSLKPYELKRQSRTRRSPGRQPSNRLFGQSGNGFVIGRL